MAWVMLSKPGTKYGPCKRACKHVDCAHTRNMAQRTCRFCDRQIGYETPFAEDPERKGEFVHRDCLWTEEERRRAAAPCAEVK